MNVEEPRSGVQPIEAVSESFSSESLTRRGTLRQMAGALGLAATAGIFTTRAASAQSATPSADGSQEANNLVVVQRWVDVIVNAHDLSQLETIVTEDCLDHPSEAQGIDALRTILEGNIAASADHQVTVQQMISVGDMVAVLAMIGGTHTGPFLGIPATGKTFSVLLIEFLRIEGDKIAERWGLLDTNSFFFQLGINPMVGPGDTPVMPASPVSS